MLFRQFLLLGSSRRRFGQRSQSDSHFPSLLWVEGPLGPLVLATVCMPLPSPLALEHLGRHRWVLATRLAMARVSDIFGGDPVQLGKGVEGNEKRGMLEQV